MDRDVIIRNGAALGLPRLQRLAVRAASHGVALDDAVGAARAEQPPARAGVGLVEGRAIVAEVDAADGALVRIFQSKHARAILEVIPLDRAVLQPDDRDAVRDGQAADGRRRDRDLPTVALLDVPEQHPPI